MSSDAETSNLSGFLESGSEIAGGIAGIAIGMVVAGPLGAFAGAAGGPLITRALRRSAVEFMQRPLSPRQRYRVSGVLLLATRRLEEMLAGGVQIRQDDFWQEQPNDRSAGDEIVEGVLLAAEQEHEERKLPYYANLLASIAVESEVSRPYANQLLRIASQLSYRQLCLLKVFSRKNYYGLNEGNYDPSPVLGESESDGWDDWRQYIDENALTILQDTYALYALGLLNYSGHFLLDLTGIMPVEMNVQGAGSRLYELMQLISIDDRDLVSLLRWLR